MCSAYKVVILTFLLPSPSSLLNLLNQKCRRVTQRCFFFERKVAAIVIRLANLALSSKSSIKAFKTLEFRIWTLQTLEFRGKMLQTLNFRVCASHKFEFSVWAFHSLPDIIIQGFGFPTVELLKVYNFQTFEFWVKPLKLRDYN